MRYVGLVVYTLQDVLQIDYDAHEEIWFGTFKWPNHDVGSSMITCILQYNYLQMHQDHLISDMWSGTSPRRTALWFRWQSSSVPHRYAACPRAGSTIISGGKEAESLENSHAENCLIICTACLGSAIRPVGLAGIILGVLIVALAVGAMLFNWFYA